MNKVLKEAKIIENELIQNRRYLHEHPECGFDLKETCDFVIKKLISYGYQPQVICESGIVATIGKPNGKTILLRADMDALPMEETTDLPFRSTNGNAHACGHDTHTSMLLGCAKLLKQHESELNGCVKLMFQPDEEGTSMREKSGAEMMLDAGVLENPHVDAAFSIHSMSGLLETGTVQTKKGALMSSCDNLDIIIQGRGAHGSEPNMGIDPINVAVHIYQALQNIIARETAAYDQTVLTIGSINGGSAGNVIADKVVMKGTLRTTNEETRTKIKERVEKICVQIASAFNAKASATFSMGIPSVYNNPQFTEEVIEYIHEIIGEKVMQLDYPVNGSDDFSVISQEIPTCYISLGAGSPSDGYCYPHHNPNVKFDESALHIGCAIYTYVALEWLKNNA